MNGPQLGRALEPLPPTVEELIRELDAKVRRAEVRSPDLNERRQQELIFQAGKRQLVDELIARMEQS